MWFSKKARTKRLRNRYAEDDPLHYQAVARRERQSEDPPLEEPGPGGSLTVEDLDWYREHPDGV